MVFVVRFVVGIIATSLVAWGVSFAVADWVTDKSISGVQQSVGLIADDLKGVRGDLREDVRTLTEKREELAEDIAERTARIIAQQDSQIGELISQLSDTTAGLKELRTSIDSLVGTVASVDERLSKSIDRQQQFEALVVQYLVTQAQPTLYKWDNTLGTKEVTSSKVGALFKATPDTFDKWLTSSTGSR
jgi:uncharacterized protein YoxC